jgi:prepilin-type N-terminal cleavage/methylation domain-containing protein
MKQPTEGFTLIELLVVIAMIGLLATMAVVAFGDAQKKARDAKRLSDMSQLQKALALYLDDNGSYPGNTDNDYNGWDLGFNGGQGSGDPFIQPLTTAGLINPVGDPSGSTNADTYFYYRYAAGASGCDAARGAFYVLGVRDMETSGRPHPDSPGWSCPSRDWQPILDWVTGGFTNY